MSQGWRSHGARRGPRLTAAQKAELWRRWREGESLRCDRPGAGPHFQDGALRRGGGRRHPACASTACASSADAGGSRNHLARLGEWELAAGDQPRPAPAALDGVSRSARHGGRRRYRAADADRAAWARGRRPKRCRLAAHPALRDAVATKLALEWSPQQIAGWLRAAYPDETAMHVSHETIYVSLFVQSRGVLKKALVAHLRQRRTYRQSKRAAVHPAGHIVDAVSIRDRPATVEDRAVPGHWEGDLILGTHRSHVATLVERRSRYVCLVRLTGKDTQTVVQALTQQVQRLPAGLMASLTWDRGLELAAASHLLDRDGRAGLLL